MGSVNANPTRRFFIENFTRDLSLEDALLDLVDNSIDACIRMNNITLSMEALLDDRVDGNRPLNLVSVYIDNEKVEILDNCGGIDIQDAEEHVFRFGRESDRDNGYLGIYGIGLKRGVFKIGKKIAIESHTLENGFRVDIDVNNWINQNSNDWSFPLTELEPARSNSETGTRIIVTELNTHISDTIQDPTFLPSLKRSIETAYAFFLQKFISIEINQHLCKPIRLPLTSSSKVEVGRSELSIDGVDIQIIAGLADKNNSWSTETAGWNVLCNGRLVLYSNKDNFTGWGQILPQFHSKFNGFLGYAFFFSHDLLKLPWTTTKRNIDIESPIYIQAKNAMGITGRPVVNFLSDMYPNEPNVEIVERKIVENLLPIGFSEILSKSITPFTVQKPVSKAPTTITVQYKVEKKDLDRVKRRLGDMKMSAGSAGKETFEYYIKHECIE